jgi:hypothetical protein
MEANITMTDSPEFPRCVIVFSLIAILVIGSLTAFAYTSSTSTLKSTLRGGFETTASVMAAQFNASEVEGLVPGDENSPKYSAIVRKLKTMRSMDDAIANAYILKVNPDRTITFLVDDLSYIDPQGSEKIGNVYTTPPEESKAIFAALSGPTTSPEPYTDKFGTWVSAYAPIDDSVLDSTGNTSAILGIDVAAQDYADYMRGKGYAIILSGIVSIFLVFGSAVYYGKRLQEAGCIGGKKKQ